MAFLLGISALQKPNLQGGKICHCKRPRTRHLQMSAGKLSKRKQKALAFREKKSVKGGTGRLATEDEETKAIPEDIKGEENSSSWLGKDASSATKGTSMKKRKRKEEVEEGSLPPPGKKVKKSSAKKTATETQTSEKPTSLKPTKSSVPSAKRYIAFVGNLPHLDPTKLQETLQSHFPTAPISIRIPTSREPSKSAKTKASATTKASESANQTKGYAFLEFDSSSAMEKALRCHHTLIGGRKINVELTAGGGGKSKERMEKIKERNERLTEERKKRVEEEKAEKAKKSEKNTDGIHPDRLKRMTQQ